ncbi:MAG: hypothetical protein JNK05_13190 [Myxococcales bacterium]|nr:hypothetical protein [Myxococcales bacterium]
MNEPTVPNVTVPTLSQEQFEAFVRDQLAGEFVAVDHALMTLRYAMSMGMSFDEGTRVSLMRTALAILFFAGAHQDPTLLRQAAAVDAKALDLEAVLPEMFRHTRKRSTRR